MSSSFNGQPPLVYAADINLDDTTASAWNLSLKGMSGERGDDHGLYPVDDRVTTARDMVRSITAHGTPLK